MTAKLHVFEEHAATPSGYAGVTIKPWSPAIGARVSGYQYEGGEVPEAVRAALSHALYNHGVLLFEPGTVSAKNFTDFIRFLGEPLNYGGPHTPKAAENPAALTIDSERNKYLRNHIWHVDGGYSQNPPRFTSLYAKELPESGGDTIFANATLAFELFDPLFRAYLESLTAITYSDATGHLADRYFDAAQLAEQRAKLPAFEVPLIATHPETGRKRINVNESYTNYIKGQTRIVSQNILGILFDAIKAPEVQLRLSWETGLLAIWDNRVVQHKGLKDYATGNRVLYRATIA